ncbi:MAG: response regulator transcription factor [Fulvivirga sp.]|nr:response regulator transcription factor [Fulvivirga sp.]
MNGITVYVTDDQTLFRKGISRLVKSFHGIGEVKEASNGKELLDMMLHQEPDVVLLDLDMPVMDGVEAAERIVSKYVNTKVIILTMHSEHEHVLHLMELGVHAFLLKDAEPEEVEQAIRNVVKNDFYQNELVVEALRKGAINRKKETSRPMFDHQVQLSDREKEILTLICRELTMKEISDKLSLSEKTIHNHRARMMKKLNAKNTVGLVKYAYESGLIN